MRAVTSTDRGSTTEQLKTVARGMGEKLTDDRKRPWHLEAAISLTIFTLGTLVLMASTQVI